MDASTLTLTGPSALAVIRASRLPGGPALVPTSLTEVPEPPRTKAAIDSLYAMLPVLSALANRGEPIHLRVPSSGSRLKNRSLRCHVSTRAYPDGSFCEVRIPSESGGAAASVAGRSLRVLVDAPPLALLEMAGLLCRQCEEDGHSLASFEARVRILAGELELCGRYGRDPLEPSGPACTYRLPPVTTAADLRRIASYEAAGNGDGARAMRASLPVVVDGFRSPLESATYLCMLQKPHWGGLSFPVCDCNGRLDLPEGASTTTGLDHITPDFLWRDWNIALETEGYTTHGTKSGRLTDNRRLRFYNDCGVTVYPALFDEVCTRRGMDSLLAGVAHALCERSGEKRQAMERRFKRTFSDKEGMRRRAVILGTFLPVNRPEE